MDKLTKILVVDDEPEIRHALAIGLRTQGYDISVAANGREALESAVMEKPDLVILDIALPDIGGLEVCKRLRQWSQMPVIVLSVRDREKDIIAALDAGADDYVTKPFGMGELLARIRAVFRRQSGVPRSEPTRLQCEDLLLDLAERRVTLRGEEIRLTPKEYDLIRYLLSHAGKIVTHRQLLTAVWGVEYSDDKALLRVHIAHLRHKIEPSPARPFYILNEPGVGYRFRAP